MRILHVVDRETGGVPVAVGSYIENTPMLDHAILSPSADSEVFRLRPEAATFVQMANGRSPVAAVRSVRACVRALQPEVVHAHSSFSGAFVRLALSHRSVRLVYTPHCFSFERTSASGLERAVFRLAERLLARNTSVIAACSPREAELASALAPRRVEVVTVPNVSSVPARASQNEPSEAEKSPRSFKVGMIGRIGGQKDPGAFVETIERLQSLGLPAEGIWLGSGKGVDEDALRARGIRVSGWVSGSRLLQEIDDLDAYVHSAAWEGFPVSILDVLARRVPSVVRNVPSFSYLPPTLRGDSAIDQMAKAFCEGDWGGWRAGNLDTWNEFLPRMYPETLTDSLEKAWRFEHA